MNEEEMYEKDIRQPLCLESTRSHVNGALWRDMVGFDVISERSRLRRAIYEVERCCYHGPVLTDDFYTFPPGRRHEKWKLGEVKNYSTAEARTR